MSMEREKTLEEFIKEWKELSPDTVDEAEEWYEAGWRDAEVAVEWCKEAVYPHDQFFDFYEIKWDPEDALEWYEAGWTDPYLALHYYAVRITKGFYDDFYVEGWKDPEDALEWDRNMSEFYYLYPDYEFKKALEWYQQDFLPEEALAWIYLGVGDVDDAAGKRQEFEEKFMKEYWEYREANPGNYDSSDFDLRKAALLWNWGKFEDLKDVFDLLRKGIGFEEIKVAIREEYDLDQLESMLEWKEKGLNAEEYAEWGKWEDKFTYEDALEWKKKGFNVIDWKDEKFELLEALEWFELGFSSEEAKEYRRSRLTPQEAKQWKEKGYSPEDVRKYLREQEAKRSKPKM